MAASPTSSEARVLVGPTHDPPEIWLDWDQSTDNSDPQWQILYDVYVNGVFSEHAAIGYGETITYSQGEGQNTITMRAVRQRIGIQQRDRLLLEPGRL